MRGIAFLACLLLLGGCSNWNEKTGSFATVGDFAGSEFAQRGYVPLALLPPSARNIEAMYNIDTTEASAEFDFAAADEDRMISPFLSPEMLRHRFLEREHSAPYTGGSNSIVYLRCNGPNDPIEYLKVDMHSHAKYWTSRDRALRSKSCHPHGSTTSPLST